MRRAPVPWLPRKNQKPPGSVSTGGLLGLVLTALEEQAVKPLAQIVGHYLCCDSLQKCGEERHGVPPPFRDWGIGEGPQTQYNTKADRAQFD